MKDSQLSENKFSLLSKNSSSNEIRHRTNTIETIESLSPGMLFKSEFIFFFGKNVLKNSIYIYIKSIQTRNLEGLIG